MNKFIQEYIKIQSDKVYFNTHTEDYVSLTNSYSGYSIRIKPGQSFYVASFFSISKKTLFTNYQLYAECIRLPDKKPFLLDLNDYTIQRFFRDKKLDICVSRTLQLRDKLRKKGLQYDIEKRVYF